MSTTCKNRVQPRTWQIRKTFQFLIELSLIWTHQKVAYQSPLPQALFGSLMEAGWGCSSAGDAWFVWRPQVQFSVQLEMSGGICTKETWVKWIVPSKPSSWWHSHCPVRKEELCGGGEDKGCAVTTHREEEFCPVHIFFSVTFFPFVVLTGYQFCSLDCPQTPSNSPTSAFLVLRSQVRVTTPNPMLSWLNALIILNDGYV